MEPVSIEIRRLEHGLNIDLPAYQSEHASGMDIHAAVESDMVIEPGGIEAVPCGFSMAIPVGYEAQIRPRSGLAGKYSISIPNAPGTIDADYRGEVKVLLVNLGREAFVVTRNMRIAQMVVKPVVRAAWVEVDDLPETTRGEGGFGHTGH